MFGKENAAAILKTLKEVYDEHIVIRTRFDALERSTEKALAEYRRLNEKLIDKVEAQERERQKSEMEILEKVNAVQARLDAFSEKAMRSAVTDLAEKFLRDNFGAVPRLQKDNSDPGSGDG